MIQGKILSYGDDLTDIFNIRRKVFIEEKGIPEEKVFDQLDKEAMHVLVYENISNCSDKRTVDKKKTPVAAGRIRYEDNVCKIDNVAVLKEYRNNQYGDFTVRMLLNKAFTAGIKDVQLLTTEDVTDFFRKIGFKVTTQESGQDKMEIKDTDMLTCCKKSPKIP